MASECNDMRDVAVPLDEETPGPAHLEMGLVRSLFEETPPADVSVDISSRRRVLYRVPPQLRENKKHIYEPVVVPLGPYHHGQKPEFEAAEQLKNEVRDNLCSSAYNKGFLLGMISERIDQVRHFYGGAGRYGDHELAEMMLRDACFLLAYMEGGENDDLICRRLGMSGAFFLSRDMNMLENQIPLWLINLIIPLIFPGQQSQSFLRDFLNATALRYQRMTQLPWGNGEEEEPLHLLEAKHRTNLRLVEKQDSSNIVRLMNKYGQPRKRSSTTAEIEMANSPFRSVTDLKAKGIHFRRSSRCLTDIQFFSFSFYGQLRLPFFYVTHNTIVLYSNLIAFELSPEAETNLGVTSYINFMKTLIDTAKDVKVLRESGILYSTLTNDEEVLTMFKSIDTYGIYDYDKRIFNDVKMRIDKHCESKAKTWTAELINTRFRSPWTITALFAAAFLLCLTFLQTYYTVHPWNNAT